MRAACVRVRATSITVHCRTNVVFEQRQTGSITVFFSFCIKKPLHKTSRLDRCCQRSKGRVFPCRKYQWERWGGGVCEHTGRKKRQRGNTLWNPAQGIRSLKRLKSLEKIGSGRIVTQLSLFPSGVIELKGKMVVGEEWGGWVEGWAAAAEGCVMAWY